MCIACQTTCGTIKHTRELRASCTSFDVRATRKQGKSAVIGDTRVKNTLPRPEVTTKHDHQYQEPSVSKAKRQKQQTNKQNTRWTRSTFYKVRLIRPTRRSPKTDSSKKSQKETDPQHVRLKHIRLYLGILRQLLHFVWPDPVQLELSTFCIQMCWFPAPW